MAKQLASVQEHLVIDQIKDGVVQLKDGSLKAVILVSSVNFALKGEDEKNSIVSGFQTFVNSLNFPIQIVIRSKRLNLDDYVAKLNKLRNAQKNELLKEQTSDYIEFVTRMLDVVNIMDKSFFVVVPFFPSGLKKVGYLDEIVGKVKPATKIEKQQTEFENEKTQLLQRVENIISGISGMGLRAVTLNTQELIELFYTLYNPTAEHTQKLVEIDELTAPIVTSAMNHEKEPEPAEEPQEEPRG